MVIKLAIKLTLEAQKVKAENKVSVDLCLIPLIGNTRNLYLIAQSFGWDFKPRSILATHAFYINKEGAYLTLVHVKCKIFDSHKVTKDFSKMLNADSNFQVFWFRLKVIRVHCHGIIIMIHIFLVSYTFTTSFIFFPKNK